VEPTLLWAHCDILCHLAKHDVCGGFEGLSPILAHPASQLCASPALAPSVLLEVNLRWNLRMMVKNRGLPAALGGSTTTTLWSWPSRPRRTGSRVAPSTHSVRPPSTQLARTRGVGSPESVKQHRNWRVITRGTREQCVD
ncbi:unnamed protein product, partial [Ectocarpus sp. 4 AP-2014]